MAYFDSTFGSISAKQFTIPGLSRIALIAKDKLEATTGGNKITAMTLEATAKFQEVFFTKNSAQYTQELTSDPNKCFVTQTLTFRVESDDIDTAHKLILSGPLVALVKKKDGKWVLLGQSNGLETLNSTNNNTNDEANLSFTLTSENLGFGANVLMDETALNALINSVTV